LKITATSISLSARASSAAWEPVKIPPYQHVGQNKSLPAPGLKARLYAKVQRGETRERGLKMDSGDKKTINNRFLNFFLILLKYPGKKPISFLKAA
jgi:hypothetical protein